MSAAPNVATASASRENRLLVQIRVLFALLLREMATRYGRSAGGYVWAFIEPAATITLLTLVFSQISRHPALGTNFPIFFATGYLAFHIYLDISRGVSAAIQANRALLVFPRVTLLDVVIARFLLHFMTSIVVAFIIISAILIYFDHSAPIDLRSLFVAVTYASLLGLGVGALNCVLFAFSPTWKRTFTIVNRPLFLISGIFYTYEVLPEAAQRLIWWNPLIHVTATTRRGFYAEYEPSFVSPVYVFIVALGALLLGILLLQTLRGRVLEGD